jgi:hypothetical protein
MIIKKEAAKIILELLNSDTKTIKTEALNNDAVKELNLAGIIRFPIPGVAEFTYGGEIVANVLNRVKDKI